ncbi:hypothetical protein HBH64_059160 [Parastagonospora nodorum]|nr:hypothetical protein HBI01_012640 [Parastagonospora nodorum]KAH4316845.1 hypothetical protein HBI02_028960 [Parastagonospora nodorum]KAH4328353.1 hypothetical protein HBI00_112060 [Parastagonospora nodorum]KAH4387991.1 hypothetical protein HBH94_028840 [Parastagonospora nodorum]KAH4475635.1 hypothetical protein HBH90_013230 [Parastagonospora nodorum]
MQVNSKVENPYDLLTHQNHLTPFLRLPSELRNTIYNLVLGNWEFRLRITPAPYEFSCRLKGSNISGWHAQTRPGFALLKVCRQINAETRLLPAQLSGFFIDAWRSSLLPVLHQILPVHLIGAIRHMRFMLMAGHDEAYMIEAVESIMEGLRGFKGLRRLDIKFRVGASLECKERFITYIKDWKTEESLLECVLFGGTKYGDWHDVEKWAV